MDYCDTAVAGGPACAYPLVETITRQPTPSRADWHYKENVNEN